MYGWEKIGATSFETSVKIKKLLRKNKIAVRVKFDAKYEDYHVYVKDENYDQANNLVRQYLRRKHLKRLWWW